MAYKDRTDPVTSPPQTPDEKRAEMDETFMRSEEAEAPDPRSRPARPDTETGEVRAGPGDVGLEDRPEVNNGSPGTEQMSNKRLRIGLGIAAVLAILVFIFAAMV